MNLGISNTQGTTWKRIKTQHIAAAASVGLAVAAAVGGLSLRDSGPAPSNPVSPVSVSRPAPLLETLVYIVGNQAEATELQQAFVSAALESDAGVTRQVMVVDSSQAEADLTSLQAELMGANAGVTIVDLRPGVQAIGIEKPASVPEYQWTSQFQEQSHPQIFVSEYQYTSQFQEQSHP
jgi:hypothetical protein